MPTRFLDTMGWMGCLAVAAILLWSAGALQAQERRALFGDLHVHTNLSFDAYIFGNRNGPDDAYRFAKGEALPHPAGFQMKLRRPLDFQAVTDHAVYLGMLPAMHDASSEVANHPLAQRMQAAQSVGERVNAFRSMFDRLGGQVEGGDDLLNLDVVRAAWADIIAAAERHNEPGRFTSFVAFEYTPGPDFRNLHRNVIFRSADAPRQPFSRLDSNNPEDLWDWMDGLRAQGIESLAIPHNSNGSDGIMFASTDTSGAPLTPAYAEQRMRNEPLAEISQVKGTSETHPLLSPNDEWANFEIMNYRIATYLPSQPQGSYLRDAWLRGLQLEAQNRGNPYRFGVVSASDTHVGAAGLREDDYWSKVGLIDGLGAQRGSVQLSWTQRLTAAAGTMWVNWRAPEGLPDVGAPPEGPFEPYLSTMFSSWGAAGLAGVWADDNTREAIYAAFRRKETFGTSGPRLMVRFFAGYNYPSDLADSPRLARLGYARGVPMGGELRARARSPDFLVWAVQDADSAPLQRVQVVKGWLVGNRVQEKIYDVACAGGARPDAQHRCPDNQARVDISTCSYSAASGASELKTMWRDPDYRPNQAAFYYVRALENPTCRWSTWDALRAQTPPNPDLAATVQERAWSSPIWLMP